MFYIFYRCSSLTSIIIPDRITSISDNAFDNCSSLSSIIIPNSVTSIGYSSFHNCSSLSSIIIPNSVTSIGNTAFAYCSGLTNINIPNSLTIIGNNVFEGCSSLTAVTIPNKVTEIGYGAFAYCKSLRSVTIPNGVKSIGSSAFQGCDYLSSVVIPSSVTTINDKAFSGCSRINDVHITSISAWCNLFKLSTSAPIFTSNYVLCKNGLVISSVSIPDSISSLGNYTFYNCSSISSVTIPSSVTTIGESAFEGCGRLSNLKLSNELKVIRKSAFKNCNNLKSITLPTTMEIIYQEAFSGCYSLESVKALSEIPPFAYDDSFRGGYNTLFVPKGCKSIYQSAQGWKHFEYISNGDSFVLTYKVDRTVYKTHEVDYGTSITPEPEPIKVGYTFSGWSEIPKIMPAQDVTVTGTFTIKKHKLIYQVDGSDYKTIEVKYGASIIPESAPTKEGYTFSGWSDIPETMPDEDVIVTGTFIANKYKLVYIIDWVEYKSYDVEFGATITPEPAPTQEGYTFSGWSEIPETMPAKNVAITGTFSKNSYTLTYWVDGEIYKMTNYDFGETITPETEPEKEGYTFSGWSEIPNNMPDDDVNITGTFTVNKYKLTYQVDGKEYKTYEVEYGSTTIPEPQPEGDYVRFAWVGIPEKMPAHDVTVTADFETGIADVIAKNDIKYIYGPNGKRVNKLRKGVNIVVMKDGTTKKIIKK